ncbi:MAG: hypothetical protein Q4D34_02235, partial [Eggerthellaceae bacterium]|nr:hypothetical protein [Eggerthellaceae bacterium]
MARMIDALKIACGMLVCSLFVFACLLYTQDAYADESTQDVSLAAASSDGNEIDMLDSLPAVPDGDDTVDALPEIDEGDEPQEQQQPEGLSDGKLSLRALEGEEGDEPTVHEDGWADEDGFTYYYVDGVRQTGWIVDTTYKDFGLQRYWIDPYQGCLVFDCLIDAADAGYWAYARPEGYVVRGWYQAADGSVYLADDDGKLEDPGWLITDDYAGGLQRYYIDEA